MADKQPQSTGRVLWQKYINEPIAVRVIASCYDTLWQIIKSKFLLLESPKWGWQKHLQMFMMIDTINPYLPHGQM